MRYGWEDRQGIKHVACSPVELLESMEREGVTEQDIARPFVETFVVRPAEWPLEQQLGRELTEEEAAAKLAQAEYLVMMVVMLAQGNGYRLVRDIPADLRGVAGYVEGQEDAGVMVEVTVQVPVVSSLPYVCREIGYTGDEPVGPE